MIKHLISKLIPPSYNKNPSIRKNVYKWLLVGLLIRYSFMPIAFHGDFLAVYGRSLLIARGSKTELSLICQKEKALTTP